MSERHTAAVAAGLTAVASLALGVVMTVLASRNQNVNAGVDLLDSLVDDGSGWWTAARWLFLAIAAASAGVAVAIRRFAVAGRRVLADWATAVGVIGLTVLAIDQVRLLSHTREIANAAASRPGDAQDLINASFLNLVDRDGIVTFGAVGLWLMVASVLLLPTRTPLGLRATGATTGVMLMLQPVLHGGEWAAAAGAVTSGVLATCFFGWYAVELTRGSAVPTLRAGAAGRAGWRDDARSVPPGSPVVGREIDQPFAHGGDCR